MRNVASPAMAIASDMAGGSDAVDRDRIFGWRPTEISPEWGLRDIRAGNACSICKTMMCEDCGMLFLDMRFDDEEMAALIRIIAERPIRPPRSL